MSGNKSRLGKGLGALFPALPGEGALTEQFDNKLDDNKKIVSHETTKATVSHETSRNVVTSANSVSHETNQQLKTQTKVPSISDAIAPHANYVDNKNKESQAVSRETLPLTQGNKHARKRSAMPSLEEVTRPIDFFFNETTTQTSPLTSHENTDRKSGDSNVKTANTTNVDETQQTAKTQPLQPVKGGYLAYLKPLDIVPNAQQPRTIFDEDELRELASSIKEVGVLQPIVVRPIEGADKNDKQIAHYELIMGERRWRASQIAGLDTVPTIVRTTSDENMLRDALLENLHRVALNPLEEAAAYSQMIDDFGLTQIQLSQSVSKSRPQIANTLRLLNLPASVQKHVASGVLSAGHARALLGLEKPEDMEALANRIIAEGLSVRSTEEIVSLKTKHESDGIVHARNRRNNKWAASPIRQQLEQRFATKVSIKGTENHGRIEIVFSSPEEMQRIVDLLVAEKQQ